MSVNFISPVRCFSSSIQALEWNQHNLLALKCILFLSSSSSSSFCFYLWWITGAHSMSACVINFTSAFWINSFPLNLSLPVCVVRCCFPSHSNLLAVICAPSFGECSSLSLLLLLSLRLPLSLSLIRCVRFSLQRVQKPVFMSCTKC